MSQALFKCFTNFNYQNQAEMIISILQIRKPSLSGLPSLGARKWWIQT